MIHFLRPEWLLALIPLALLLWQLKRQQYQASSWNRYIAPHLAKVLVSGQATTKKGQLGLISFIWLVGILALSGPALTKQNLPVFESNLGRVIVMDMSLSMYATDLAPNRLTQAKFKATDLIKSLKEGETGLVAYAGDAFTISPLTRDKATLLNLLPTLSPEIMPVLGSNLPAAISQAKQLLLQGGHLKGEIILVTDGINPEQISDTKSLLADSQYRLSIMAMGTTQGAAIRLPDGQLMRDNSDQVVVSKTNLNQLGTLANHSGGELFSYRADGQDLESLIDSLSQETDAKASELEGETWQDLGPYLTLLLLLPVLLSFRQAFAAIACFLVLAPSPQAQAISWQHPFSTDDQRAMQAYQADQHQQAAELFNSPQWKASALYKSGDYQQALALFEQDDSANGLYNQGNSLMQLNDLDKAIERYQQALDKDPQLTQAKQNLELAKQLKEQHTQDGDGQEQSDQDESQQDAQQEKSQQEQSEQNADQDNGEQGNASQDGAGQDNAGQDSQGQDSQGQESEQQANQNSEPSQSSDGNSSEQADSEQDKSAKKNQESSSQDNENQSGEQQSSSSPNNDAQMSADPEQADKSGLAAQEHQAESERSNAQADMAQGNPSESDEQGETDAQTNAAMSNVIAPEELPPEMQRALTGVIDDPQVLLRNKMQLEYQKRRRQGATIKDNQQW